MQAWSHRWRLQTKVFSDIWIECAVCARLCVCFQAEMVDARAKIDLNKNYPRSKCDTTDANALTPVIGVSLFWANTWSTARHSSASKAEHTHRHAPVSIKSNSKNGLTHETSNESYRLLDGMQTIFVFFYSLNTRLTTFCANSIVSIVSIIGLN